MTTPPCGTPDRRKLMDFGFREDENGAMAYTTGLLNGQMLLTVTVTPDGSLTTAVTDPDTGEEYRLHLIPEATGAFVGQVRTEYEEILGRILANCFETFRPHEKHTAQVLAHILETYGDEPEYLWESSPDCAAIRHRDSGKWYAALLKVSRRKLGEASDEEVKVLNLKAKPDAIPALLSRPGCYPAYHMNKKHWFSVCLDGSVPFGELCGLLAESHRLTGAASAGKSGGAEPTGMNEQTVHRILAAVCEIPAGKVATYGQIAARIGKERNARLVGKVLSMADQFGDRFWEVPCHRVVNSSGRLTPGWQEQASLLLREGVSFRNADHVDMKRCRWDGGTDSHS